MRRRQILTWTGLLAAHDSPPSKGRSDNRSRDDEDNDCCPDQSDNTQALFLPSGLSFCGSSKTTQLGDLLLAPLGLGDSRVEQVPAGEAALNELVQILC